jgi:flagellar biosynthesis protein FlhB
MSDAGDKRYDATASRRERAKREGNSARSTELCAVASFAAATLAAVAAVPLAAAAIIAMLRGSTHAVVIACVAALLPALAAATAGVVVALAQGGGLHVVAPKLDPKRLDPIAGFKRMVGGEALVGVVRAAIAFGAALAAMWPLGRDVVASGATLASPGAAAALAGSAALRACGAALAVGALFAIADYALARRRWLRGLRMSYDELKRDAKENDGDPQARSRRTTAHRAIVRGTIGQAREASFVVVNPTHVAVALRYAPPETAVPQILVRALDDAALRVRTIALAHGIPLVENVALARLLYAQGESGRAIPPEAYVAVAQVVASLGREGLLS